MDERKLNTQIDMMRDEVRELRLTLASACEVMAVQQERIEALEVTVRILENRVVDVDSGIVH